MWFKIFQLCLIAHEGFLSIHRTNLCFGWCWCNVSCLTLPCSAVRLTTWARCRPETRTTKCGCTGAPMQAMFSCNCLTCCSSHTFRRDLIKVRSAQLQHNSALQNNTSHQYSMTRIARRLRLRSENPPTYRHEGTHKHKTTLTHPVQNRQARSRGCLPLLYRLG